LNNTALADLPDTLHNLIDVNSAMAMVAIDNFTVNLDSYIGRCVNYYFYHRDLDSRVVFAKWDQNEAWGLFNQYNLSLTQLKLLNPYWVSTQAGENRPLAERLWQVAAYDNLYLGHIKKLLSGAAQPDTLLNRMEELRDLIRSYVYSDPNCMFTTTQFENAMSSDQYYSAGPPPGRLIPGLEDFIRDRDAYLQALIGTWTPVEGLVLNEIMASNDATAADEHGDFDDWIEIANVGLSAINLNGFVLTDHWEGSPDFVFPDTTLQPGDYMVVWADEEPGEGSLHAPFKLDGDGEDVYLTDGQVIVDQVTFPALASNVSWGRWTNGAGDWEMLSMATIGTENLNPHNPESVNLVINEFLAANDSVLPDETGTYEDWLEIYNPGPDPVDMLGLFLTDDLTSTTQWSFPDTTLEAGGFLLVWTDNDLDDGPLHTNFKLSADGEEIGLFGRLTAGNELIDSYTFGAQTADISEGRESDGGASWVFFETPTPGASNQSIEPPDSCCIGSVGNVVLDIGTNCDNITDQSVDVGDLTNLIDYLFINFTPICCPDEADVAPAIFGEPADGMVDVGDLTALIDHLFINFPVLPACS
ncbi:MAG: lamin tail domain-containing protein, partial [candidate division Zixibacteria bacterium]|nr:lamin tail domain-containing protein [candidate division Zixibacteria bacterium]